MIGVDTTWLIDLEITDSPRHEGALQLFEKWRSQKNSMLAIYYQSFLEFQHVVTDSKRFNSPLTMEQALERCWFWIDQERIKIIYPGETSLKRSQLLHSTARHQNGSLQTTTENQPLSLSLVMQPAMLCPLSTPLRTSSPQHRQKVTCAFFLHPLCSSTSKNSTS